MDCTDIIRAQALLAINDHLGERVSVELYVSTGRRRLAPGPLIALSGELRRLYPVECMAEMPDWEREGGATVYLVGDQLIDLDTVVGGVSVSCQGVRLNVATNLVLWLTWDEAEMSA